MTSLSVSGMLRHANATGQITRRLSEQQTIADGDAPPLHAHRGRDRQTMSSSALVIGCNKIGET